ncbi:MAG: pyridoxal-phosphate dependent enzyme [Bacteroidota bacterium]
MNSNFILPSPIQELTHPLFEEKALSVFVKRDDEIHPSVSGNKWRKLKYNLLAAQKEHHTLLTFGGAFSNHIAATAVAGQVFQFKTIGIIRGEAYAPLNYTLQLAQDHGMQLHYVSRTAFRTPDRLALAKTLVQEDFYFLPEGGTNTLALKGCAELVAEIEVQMGGHLPDYICTCCGTGGTLAGIVSGLGGRSHAIGVSALKGDFLTAAVRQLLPNQTAKNWQIINDYHFGGYAKFKPELITFINDFKAKHQIPLDPIYTGKLFYGIFDLMAKDFFPPNQTILLVHTGGLQGIYGFNQRFGNLLNN